MRYVSGFAFDLKLSKVALVEIVDLKDIHILRSDMIENLPWLIGMAMDSITDGRPKFATVSY